MIAPVFSEWINVGSVTWVLAVAMALRIYLSRKGV